MNLFADNGVSLRLSLATSIDYVTLPWRERKSKLCDIHDDAGLSGRVSPQKHQAQRPAAGRPYCFWLRRLADRLNLTDGTRRSPKSLATVSSEKTNDGLPWRSIERETCAAGVARRVCRRLARRTEKEKNGLGGRSNRLKSPDSVKRIEEKPSRFYWLSWPELGPARDNLGWFGNDLACASMQRA
jgi:hypothetical protein